LPRSRGLYIFYMFSSSCSIALCILSVIIVICSVEIVEWVYIYIYIYIVRPIQAFLRLYIKSGGGWSDGPASRRVRLITAWLHRCTPYRGIPTGLVHVAIMPFLCLSNGQIISSVNIRRPSVGGRHVGRRESCRNPEI